MKSEKLDIMKTRPDISDQEIEALMNFDKVLSKHHSIKSNRNSAWVWGMGVVALIISGVLLFSLEETEEKVHQPDQPLTTPESNNQPEPKPANEPEIEKPQPTEGRPQQKKQPIQQQSKPVEMADVYTEAEPVNGYPDLYSYFHNELTYPVEALKDSIEGVVSVSFVINKQGKPEQIKIQNSLGEAFDNEAIRLIAGMPEWKPASLNGKPMPARISIPLTFQLKQKSQP